MGDLDSDPNVGYRRLTRLLRADVRLGGGACLRWADKRLLPRVVQRLGHIKGCEPVAGMNSGGVSSGIVRSGRAAQSATAPLAALTRGTGCSRCRVPPRRCHSGSPGRAASRARPGLPVKAHCCVRPRGRTCRRPESGGRLRHTPIRCRPLGILHPVGGRVSTGMECPHALQSPNDAPCEVRCGRFDFDGEAIAAGCQ